MNFLNNEKGVSEVIGALLIFLILVIVLGSIQVYEVPKWNKELEKQNFNIVSTEFIEMKSDLEDVSSQFIPRTSALHMGVKYPERFMLRNPSPAYGTLTTYPLNITVNITLSDSSGGNITYHDTKYTSNGIEYKLNGLSNFPKLVYEHGLLIKDFGEVDLTDSAQSLLIGNEFFIPIIHGNSITLSSVETESLNFLPLEMSIFNTTNSDTGIELIISRINITMDTKYNKTWNEIFNDTNVRIEGNKIKISIPGSFSSSRKYFVYPTEVPYQNSIYSGMLKFTSNPNALRGLKGENGGSGGGSYGGTCFNDNGTIKPECIAAVTVKGDKGEPGGLYGVPSGPTELEGAYTNEIQSMNRINIPTSINVSKFTIEDLIVVSHSTALGRSFKFIVTDKNKRVFSAEVEVTDRARSGGGSGTGLPEYAKVKIINSTTVVIPEPYPRIGETIDLTQHYRSANLGYPNSLVTTYWESPSTNNPDSTILYFKYIIR